MIPRSYYSPLFFLLALKALAAPLHALPDVKFDKSNSLGTWEQFVTRMGLQNESQATVYFDTDKLVAGRFTGEDPDRFAGINRQQRLQNVGRIVKQVGGPETVVYDFDEIYTQTYAAGVLTVPPQQVLIFGRRPAAIVADGQISNWPTGRLLGPEAVKSAARTLSIEALNSCDPDSTGLVAPTPTRARGGRGAVAKLGSGYFLASGGGGGGYGTPGAPGENCDIFLTIPPDTRTIDDVVPVGRGGASFLNWNVLRPGSPGGAAFDKSLSRFVSGGPGGGAVYVKSGGRLDLFNISADGSSARLGWTNCHSAGVGSGGHVVLESPEIPSINDISLYGFRAGAGAVEFREIPGPPEVSRILGVPPSHDSYFQPTPVRLPRAVAFPSDKKPGSYHGEPEVNHYIVSEGPRSPVPTVTVRVPRTSTRAKMFKVGASATARNVPSAIRFRVLSPNAAFFGAWNTVLLPGDGLRKSWFKDVVSVEEGTWWVEVVAEDTKGRRSTGRVVEMIVDRTAPNFMVSGYEVEDSTNKPGQYVFFATADEYAKWPSFSGLAQVEHRLRSPGSKRFGSWVSSPLKDHGGNNSAHHEIRLPVTLDPSVPGDWVVELRVVDSAGNASRSETRIISQ